MTLWLDRFSPYVPDHGWPAAVFAAGIACLTAAYWLATRPR